MTESKAQEERVFILAGTYDQAQYVARERGIENWRYISRSDQLRGLRAPLVLRYGTYTRRDDYEEIENLLKVYGAEEIGLEK